MGWLPDREVIGEDKCPIMFRWELVNLGPRVGKLMLHHFLPLRDDLHPHDHPSAFVTLILRGGYDDMVTCGRCGGRGNEPAKWQYTRACWGCLGTGLQLGERMRAGMIRYRRAEHTHLTKMGAQGAWTLCWMGPKERPWGFVVAGRWMRWQAYVDIFAPGKRC